jgi:hypothetical protein
MRNLHSSALSTSSIFSFLFFFAFWLLSTLFWYIVRGPGVWIILEAPCQPFNFRLWHDVLVVTLCTLSVPVGWSRGLHGEGVVVTVAGKDQHTPYYSWCGQVLRYVRTVYVSLTSLPEKTVRARYHFHKSKADRQNYQDILTVQRSELL